MKRSDWEAFLKEFAELAKRYEVLLEGFDLVEAKCKAEDKRVKWQMKTMGRVQSAIEKLCKETEETLLATGTGEA